MITDIWPKLITSILSVREFTHIDNQYLDKLPIFDQSWLPINDILSVREFTNIDKQYFDKLVNQYTIPAAN